MNFFSSLLGEDVPEAKEPAKGQDADKEPQVCSCHRATIHSSTGF